MARPIEFLSVDMRKRSKTIQINLNRLMRKTTHAAADTLVKLTPADTGRARSNYVGSLDTPSMVKRGPYAPGSHLGMAERANADAAISQINSAAAGFDVRRNSSIVISNSVPYIKKLDSGKGSKQNTVGDFREFAIHSARAVVRAFKIVGA